MCKTSYIYIYCVYVSVVCGYMCYGVHVKVRSQFCISLFPSTSTVVLKIQLGWIGLCDKYRYHVLSHLQSQTYHKYLYRQGVVSLCL